MKDVSTLVLHNLKKQKGQYLSFGSIILLTAFILHIALVLAFQTSNAYDDAFARLDTADINVLIPQAMEKDSFEKDIEAMDGVDKVEIHEGISLNATVKDFAGSDFDMNTVFYNMADDRSLNRFELESETDGTVYVPLYLQEFGGFGPGDSITWTIDGKDRTHTVAGVLNEMQYGNYGTGRIGIWFPETEYTELKDEFEPNVVTEYSIKTGGDLDALKTDLTEFFREEGVPVVGMNDRDSGKQVRTMVATLLIVIFVALALLVLAISIFLSNYKIRSTIEDELAQMGVLKATGYTSKQIMLSAVLPYVFTGAVSSLLGTLLSLTVIPAVAKLLAVQSGFAYTPHFDWMAALISILVPTLAILLFSWHAARKIKTLQPIDALRGTTGKSGVGQSVLLFAVSFFILVLLGFAGTLFYNVNIEADNFIKTLSEESPSVIFTAKDGDMDHLLKTLEKDGDVDKAFAYATVPVSHPDGSLTAFVSPDFAEVTNDICYEGTNPKTAKEVALGSALQESYAIGDSIELSNGDKKATYKVTGFVQSVNNGGEVCELTDAGFERIGTVPETVNVYLKEEGAKSFIKKYEDEVRASLDYEKLAKASRSLYAGIVSVVTGVLLVISILLVLLVLFVVIRSMIVQRRQEFGIYKAIGYTSRQLTLKTALEFIPTVAAGALLSALLGLWYLPKMNATVFSLIGAMKNHFAINLGILLGTALLFTAIAFVISVLLARPIKKITAYSLLKE